MKTRSFRVGAYVVTIEAEEVEPGFSGLTMPRFTWFPDMPTGLSRSEWKQYRKGRDKALREIYGQPVAILEPYE